MSTRGNDQRTYNSPRRRGQAAATRAQILASAQRLFERDGYAATSMAAVAADAGVSLKTVYVAVIQAAAPGDAEIGALWQRIQTEFHANQREVVESLHGKRALRTGLEVDTAADILWTLNHPGVYRSLVGDRGWTPERYERWLTDVLGSQLLREG
jgi:hypothetical protein